MIQITLAADQSSISYRPPNKLLQARVSTATLLHGPPQPSRQQSCDLSCFRQRSIAVVSGHPANLLRTHRRRCRERCISVLRCCTPTLHGAGEVIHLQQHLHCCTKAPERRFPEREARRDAQFRMVPAGRLHHQKPLSTSKSAFPAANPPFRRWSQS